MATLIKHESLYYREGSSDKQYDLYLEQDGGNWIARTAWGRRGNLNQSSTLYDGADRYSAESAYRVQRDKKIKKGYTLGEEGVPFSGIERETQEQHSGIMPMLLTPIDRAQAKKLLKDNAWIMQQKFDGIRQLVLINDAQSRGINRRGLFVGLPQDIEQEFNTQFPAGSYVIDGELVDGTFHVFDLLVHETTDISSTPYTERLELLSGLLDECGPFTKVRMAYTAYSADEKAQYLQQMAQENAEGVVLKRADGTYQRGIRALDAVKLKFWESCTCRVVKVNQQRSVELELKNGNGWVSVGNCTIPSNYPVPSVGDRVEIKYLYAYPGGSIYQPQYKGVRPDVAADECTLSQLKYKAGTQQAAGEAAS